MLKIDPYLHNPAPGWKYDLPGPCSLPEIEFVRNGGDNPINHINSHYLEIPSPSILTRGVIVWTGFLGLLVAGFMLWIFLSILTQPNAIPFFLIFISIITTLGVIWLSIFVIRQDLFFPRDEPIRFNRSRQKVYIYHFRYSWLRPLSKTEWGVEISVHDWDELWLEACTAYGSLEYGGSIQRVQISAQKNRTSDKRYSRVFSHSIRTGEAYWAMIRLYMQQGQHALPPFKNPPQPREDEEMFYNIFWDYAPRVVWPADIDLESRTGPEHDATLPFD